MVGVAHATMASPDSIFCSVFPAAALDHTTPTPVATPDLAFTAPGQSFGSITSPVAHKQQQPLSAAQLQVKRTIAWSTATRFLSLAALSAGDLHSSATFAGPHRIKTREVEEAIDFLLSGVGPHGLFEEDLDLVEWYMLEVRTHFLDHAAPAIQQAWSSVCVLPHLVNSAANKVRKFPAIKPWNHYGKQPKDWQCCKPSTCRQSPNTLCPLSPQANAAIQ
jgi:hypothetical protein